MSKKSDPTEQSVSRRQFLHGDFAGKYVAIRPPWAVEESRFEELCSGCGECIGHCPAAILGKGRGGYPVVDFSVGQCDFCAECVNHCPTGALQPRHHQTDVAWRLKAKIADVCLALHNVVCRSCAEQCESRAIEFRLRAGRVPQPELDLSRCNGCGACYAPCPVNAISIGAV